MARLRRRLQRPVPWKLYECHFVLTEAEAAALMHTSLSKLRVMRRLNQGPRYMIFGRFIRYAFVDVFDFLNREETASGGTKSNNLSADGTD